MPFCTSCGSKAADDAKFCWTCGKPISTLPTSIETPNNVQKDNPERYKDLSIQELINLANNGDSEAMIRVAAYYLSLDPNLEINGKLPKRIAQDWMEKAALAGHAGGIPVICPFYDTLAHLSEIAHWPADKSVIDSWRESYKWYQLGYKLYINKAPGYEAIKDFQEFTSYMERARYNLASSIFISGAFDEAQKLVSGYNDIPSQIIDIIVNYINISDRIANKKERNEPIDDSDVDEYYAAIHRFKIIFDDEYGEKTKVLSEEIIYAMAGQQLADHYINVAKDLNTAFDVLNYIRSNMKIEKLFHTIDKELSHFKRNNDGSLIYI